MTRTAADDTAVDRASLLPPPAPTPGARAERARAVVCEAFAASAGVVAAWECGSASFGRADAGSDVDLCVLTRAGMAAACLDEAEVALRAVEPTLATWHVGRSPFGLQRVWQPDPSTPDPSITMVDLAAMEFAGERELWEPLLEPERHGSPIVLHDPEGLLAEHVANRPPFDAAAHRGRMQGELERLRARRAMVGPFVAKELDRGRLLDAHWSHRAMVVGPLVTLLGLLHRPLRYDFAMRYLHDELPVRVAARLLPLVEPVGVDGLRAAHVAALEWIDELLDVVDPAAAPIEEHSRQMRAAARR